jgi:kynurenine formamidase
MICTVTIGTARYDVDLDSGLSIAIPLDFHGPQPNAYGVPAASAAAFEGGGFIGDTRRGGSCNFETLTVNPHCNGTHTECIGHLTKERISIQRLLPGALFPATVLSVPVIPGAAVTERYSCPLRGDDAVVTRAALLQCLRPCSPGFLDALVIRTLPNSVDKLTQQYAHRGGAFFTIDAMEEIVELGVRHLLVDVPSLDRADDEGLLAVHRVFWRLPASGTEVVDDAAVFSTVTEMIFVPDHLRDGQYLLSLQIAPFVSDAAPSRPILFPVSPRP